MMRVEAVVPKEIAEQRLRPRGGFFASSRPRKLECVHTPACIVSVIPGAREAVFVDALSADARIIDSESIARAEHAATCEYPPRLTEETITRIARKTWVQAAMLQRKATGSDDHGDPDVFYVSYPYWILYIEKRGRIDIRALDAVTGEKIGQKQKLAILEAFCEADRATESGAVEHAGIGA